VQAICPSVKDFDRDFCSLCFALATGVGKTRLMGAFISYLHEAHGIRKFVVIAPNLTIYNKLISDFTPGTKKYVFQGIRAFASNAPIVITGETYQSGNGVLSDDLFKDSVVINIFNISKLTAKDKGHLDAKDEKAKVARIRRLVETIGESYFDYLAGCDDLVVLMDESHRYRAEAGMAAINELKPILGLELTATPLPGGFVKVKTGSNTDETVYNNWYQGVYMPPADASGADGDDDGVDDGDNNG
jgi:type III restriction enzyme